MALVLFFHLLAVLSLASGKPILIPRQAQGASQAVAQPLFDVSLESLGNTTVKAQVMNVGTENLRVVQRGGILDQLPTKKVTVHGGDTDPTFTGVRVEYILDYLSADGFVEISPSQTVESIFDIATFYALSPGQEYTAIADGVIEYTTLSNTRKFFTSRYKSNTITFTAPEEIDANPRLEDRSVLVCSDEYTQVLQQNIARAADMAAAAAADARTGSALFQKFFKSTSQSDMSEVAGRFDAIAKEASSAGAGQLTYYCEPTPYDHCAGNVAAMMYPTLNKVVNCPGYYTSTKVSNYCSYLDQASITLHEYAHADALYPPGTEDIAYGYDAVLSLDTEQAKANADSFAYYASAVYLQCAPDDSITIGTPLGDVTAGITVDIDSETSTSTDTETTDTTTTTTTAEPTNPPPTEDPTSPSGGWGWGAWGNGGFWGHDDNDNDNTDTANTASGTNPQDPGSVTTSGDSLFNLQDLLDWLMERYAGQGRNSGFGFKAVSSTMVA
ncbi:Deuterolysin metalloprotease family-domain-containing protein [Aspergillus egyptiacus]|nr:Deuterolysin metalloprotease family-domain-containing protein [Aspergillus egyptiacus]